VTSNHIFKEKKNGKCEKKRRIVELLNDKEHIFWRSAGGNALGGRDMNS
jgi:hypothetical protein